VSYEVATLGTDCCIVGLGIYLAIAIRASSGGLRSGGQDRVRGTCPNRPSGQFEDRGRRRFASQPAAGVQGADPDKVKHDGGIDDVNAIGNRNVGCNRGMGTGTASRSRLPWASPTPCRVEGQSKLVTDSVVTEYVNRLGQNLVRNSDAQVPFTIKVIDSDQVNAFAFTGRVLLREFGLDPGGR